MVSVCKRIWEYFIYVYATDILKFVLFFYKKKKEDNLLSNFPYEHEMNVNNSYIHCNNSVLWMPLQ